LQRNAAGTRDVILAARYHREEAERVKQFAADDERSVDWLIRAAVREYIAARTNGSPTPARASGSKNRGGARDAVGSA
jgi:Ribbon-helix-helix protein, copG family